MKSEGCFLRYHLAVKSRLQTGTNHLQSIQKHYGMPLICILLSSARLFSSICINTCMMYWPVDLMSLWSLLLALAVYLWDLLRSTLIFISWWRGTWRELNKALSKLKSMSVCLSGDSVASSDCGKFWWVKTDKIQVF